MGSHYISQDCLELSFQSWPQTQDLVAPASLVKYYTTSDFMLVLDGAWVKLLYHLGSVYKFYSLNTLQINIRRSFFLKLVLRHLKKSTGKKKLTFKIGFGGTWENGI